MSPIKYVNVFIGVVVEFRHEGDRGSIMDNQSISKQKEERETKLGCIKNVALLCSFNELMIKAKHILIL